jgi:ATP-dependent DNA ligase
MIRSCGMTGTAAFSSFDSLASSLARIPHEGGVILDGEIACVDTKGQPCLNDLLFRRREPCFFAFDLLYRNGNDCRRDSESFHSAPIWFESNR